MDEWDNEGGKVDEDYEENNDREPRNPIAPDKQGGAMLPIPIREEELICV